MRGSVSLHTHSADQGIFSTPNFSLPNTPTSTLEKFSSTPQKTLHHSRNNSVFPVDVLQDAHEELYRKVTDLLGNKRVNNSTDFSIPDSLGSLVGPCRVELCLTCIKLILKKNYFNFIQTWKEYLNE